MINTADLHPGRRARRRACDTGTVAVTETGGDRPVLLAGPNRKMGSPGGDCLKFWHTICEASDRLNEDDEGHRRDSI
jgi:hypothetical protein